MWTTTTIAGRPADVFTPADRPRFVLLFLTDFDGQTLRENPVWTELLNSNRLVCICPDGGESWWASKICPSFDPSKSAEQYFLNDLIPSVIKQFEVPSNAIAFAGIGAGGQGALRLAFKYPDRLRVAGSLNAAIDHYELYGRGTCLDAMYPSREHCRQDG